MTRVLVGAFMLLLSVTGAALGLEVQEGRVRLVLHEDSARFSLYLSPQNGDDPGPVALFVAEDPRTSELSVLEGNRIHRMGTSGGFSQQVERLDDGGRFVWTSSTLRVEQRFAFIRSVGSSVADGVRVTVTVTNLGERATTVAVRYLFDTYLGERSNVHFATGIRDSIARETRITPSQAEPYWESTAGENDVAFQQMIYGPGVTVPRHVVVANWKRLNEAGWSFDVNPDRSFNLLPYSINDSAVLVTYPESVVAPEGEYEVVTHLGGRAPLGYQRESVSAAERDPAAALDEVNALIDEIDRLLNQEEVPAADVSRVRRMLEELKSEHTGM